jgi:predicted RecB family endonuclease
MADIVDHLEHMWHEHDWRTFRDAAIEIKALRSEIDALRFDLVQQELSTEAWRQIANRLFEYVASLAEKTGEVIELLAEFENLHSKGK